MDEVRPFAYWDGPDHSLLTDFLAEWQGSFPAMRIVGDDLIVPVLQQISPDDVALYRRLRIPAAKSDIARLVALYESGGLYIDCHCGLRDRGTLVELAATLTDVEVVLWQRSLAAFPRPAAEIRPVNTALLARPRSPLILDLLHRCLANLRTHADREDREGQVGYDIWRLTGAGVYRDVLHEPDSQNTRLRAPYAGRVGYSTEENGPVAFWRHVKYRGTGANHWSKRQTAELLFSPGPSIRPVDRPRAWRFRRRPS